MPQFKNHIEALACELLTNSSSEWNQILGFSTFFYRFVSLRNKKKEFQNWLLRAAFALNKHYLMILIERKHQNMFNITICLRCTNPSLECQQILLRSSSSSSSSTSSLFLTLFVSVCFGIRKSFDDFIASDRLLITRKYLIKSAKRRPIKGKTAQKLFSFAACGKHWWLALPAAMYTGLLHQLLNMQIYNISKIRLQFYFLFHLVRMPFDDELKMK